MATTPAVKASTESKSKQLLKAIAETIASREGGSERLNNLRAKLVAEEKAQRPNKNRR